MKDLNIAMCFDHNYVLPAAVSIYSLLEHAKRPGVRYCISAVGADFTDQDRALLSSVVGKFENARLAFETPPELGFDVATVLKGSHFSAALFFKMLLPRLFPDCDRLLVLDADTVYNDDVAVLCDEVAGCDDFYLAGAWDQCYARWHCKGLIPDGRVVMSNYSVHWTEDEREKLIVNAGLMVLNCRKIVADGIVDKWIEMTKRDFGRLTLPEQEVMNFVCDERVLPLSWRSMAYAHFYPEYYKMSDSERQANPVWIEMFENPVQIHFTDRNKPWQYPALPMAGLWFDACIRAGLFDEWRKWYGQYSRPMVTWAKRIALFEKVFKVFGRELHLSLYRKGREVSCEK